MGTSWEKTSLIVGCLPLKKRSTLRAEKRLLQELQRKEVLGRKEVVFLSFLSYFPLSPSGSLSKYYKSNDSGVDSVIVNSTQSTLLNDVRKEGQPRGMALA